LKSIWPTPRMNAIRPEPPFCGCGTQRHVRRLRRDLGDAGLAAGLEHLAGGRGDRDRSVLQVLLAELRRDDDFRVFVLVRLLVRLVIWIDRLILGKSRRCQAGDKCERGDDAERLELHQASSRGGGLIVAPAVIPCARHAVWTSASDGSGSCSGLMDRRDPSLTREEQ
jgi:hypothetical protein